MDAVFDIYDDRQVVGKAVIEKMGLYYQVYCSCNMPEGKIYRVSVHACGKDHNLGVCIPNNGCLEIKTKIPVSRLGTGGMQFFIEYESQNKAKFYPISCEKAFSPIEILRNCIFSNDSGTPGLREKQHC